MTRFDQGLAASAVAHAVVLALVILVVGFHTAHRLRVAQADFSHAIAVTLAQPPAPAPATPPPEAKPQPVEPQPPPESIATQAQQAQVLTPPPAPKPPPAVPEPAPPVSPQEADYEQIVSSILEQNKRYPRQALLEGEEGAVTLSFVVNREGTVLAFTLEQPSGRAVFDNEVRQLIRSVRFPPFPPGDPDQRKSFEFTIEFTLRD